MPRSSRIRTSLAISIVPALAGAAPVATAATKPGAPLANGSPAGTQIAPEPADPLANGRLVRPAGTQVAMPGRPMGLALSPDGRRLLVTGQGIEQSLTLADARTGRALDVVPVDRPGAVAGTAVFSRSGAVAYVAGAGSGTVWRYAVRGDRIVALRPIRLAPIVARDEVARGLTVPYPTALALARDGRRLYVADELGDAVKAIDLPHGPARRIAGGDGPLALALHPDGRRLYVADAAAGAVALVDPTGRRPRRTIAVGRRPVALAVDRAAGELFVADADGDTVVVVDTRAQRVIRTIRLAGHSAATRGHSPVALALDARRRRLYVACAADDAVAVVALAPPRRHRGDRVLGRIPTGAYPSALTLDRAGRRLVVANAKGEGDETGAGGSLSLVALPDAAGLRRMSATVRESNRCRGACAPDATLRALRGRIDHVVYILKENRAYDDVFADLGPHGDGRPRFDADVAPNHRALARRFVLLDDFHAVGSVSPDGKAWSLGAFANDYVERNWPATYSFRKRPSDYLGANPASAAPAGQLWDAVARAGRTYRNYGAWASGTVPVRVPASAPGLAAHTDANFPGYNRRFSDQRRVAAFLAEFRAFERRGRLPDVIFMSLNNDHLLGTRAGYRTPAAMMADNDLALGRVVDAISHSRFWPRTAIFVAGDDAQGNLGRGSRSVALVISPYTQRARVDSTRYSTLSVVRTIEELLGLEPLSQFDATAPLMSAAFAPARPVLAPYDAIVPHQRLDELNPGPVRVGATFAAGAATGLALGVALTLAGTAVARRRREASG